MKYKLADNDRLQKELAATIRSILETTFGPKIAKVNSSNIMHTELQPEGDVFTITFVIETHEKKEAPKQ